MEWIFLVWSGYFSYGGDISRIAKHEPKTWSLITEINKENDVINVWSGFLSG
jgi:prephenate dehydrogenase